MQHDDAPSTRPQDASDDERVNPWLFSQHVLADLTAVIAGYACFVRLGMESYSGAYNACRLYACRRGSWGFNPVHLTELEEWIQDRLGAAIRSEVV